MPRIENIPLGALDGRPKRPSGQPGGLCAVLQDQRLDLGRLRCRSLGAPASSTRSPPRRPWRDWSRLLWGLLANSGGEESVGVTSGVSDHATSLPGCPDEPTQRSLHFASVARSAQDSITPEFEHSPLRPGLNLHRSLKVVKEARWRADPLAGQLHDLVLSLSGLRQHRPRNLVPACLGVLHR
jgi:hypothetical protein